MEEINETSFSKRETRCMDWSKVVLSALLSLILAIFTIVYSLQQDSIAHANRLQDLSIANANRHQDMAIAQANRDQDQRQADELRRQLVFDTYINEVSELFLKHTILEKEQLEHIQVKTLNTLRHVDGSQKREIILFLYAKNLIQNKPPPLNLTGADLNNIHFVRSPAMLCNLNNLSLPGILAANITFDDCQLNHAVFDGASMPGALFIDSKAQWSSFIAANLTEAIFNRTALPHAIFTDATLHRVRYSGLWPLHFDFTSADLFGSDFTDEALTYTDGGFVNIFVNTRFPNGSFSSIDAKNLLIDGGAEMACSNSSSSFWYNESGSEPVYMTKPSNGSEQPTPIEGKCYFELTSQSQVSQWIIVRSFSHFIQSGHAHFNLSAYFASTSALRLEQAYIRLRFATEDDTFSLAEDHYMDAHLDQHAPFALSCDQDIIPARTRKILITLGVEEENSSSTTNLTDVSWFIDKIHLSIFKEDSKQ